MTTQNAGEMTVEECRDWLAVNSGWRQINDPMAAKGTRRLVWFGATKTLRYGYHPIPATLDESAKLSDGWVVNMTLCVGLVVDHAICRIEAHHNHPPAHGFDIEADTEILARFRLRVAVEMAENERSKA